MGTFAVRGAKAQEAPENQLRPIEDYFKDVPDSERIFDSIEYRKDQSFVFGPEARGEPAETVECEIDDDDVIEIVFLDNTRRWMSVDRFREEFGQGQIRGETSDATFINGTPGTAVATRGAFKWTIKALNVIGIDVAESAAEAAIEKVAAHIENKLESPGSDRIFRLSSSGALSFQPVTESDIRSAKRILLLIHGTFSSTRGSFADLWETGSTSEWTELLRRYKGHVYGFEHRTLTASPLENVIELVRQLPTGVRIDLVSHSRGGLVGEFLCRSRNHFTEREVELPIYREDQKLGLSEKEQLQELNSLFDEKKPEVERFVRVACPARGTILASDRADKILSAMCNVLELIPALDESDLFYGIKTFLFALIKQKADPTSLPGIEAMRASSPLIALVNTATTVSSDLTVLAGDSQGSGFLQSLMVGAADRFYGEDHDFVVQTSSMYEGNQREREKWRQFTHRDVHVNHFSYFRNPTTVHKLIAALKDETTEGFSKVVDEARAAPRGESRAPREAITGDRPVVFVIPGILGSHLDVGGERTWLDKSGIIFGEFERLRIDSTEHVEPSRVFDGVYGDLIKYLGETHDVVPFPFDWRLSLNDEAERLDKSVREALEEVRSRGRPLRFLAHSMGGLLALSLMANYRATWDEVFEHPDARFLMLGTPTKGSYSAVEIALGRERTLRLLAAMDLKNSLPELQDIVRQFPGVLELLPHKSDSIDFCDPKHWADLAKAESSSGLKQKNLWRAPEKGMLEKARDFHQKLGAELDQMRNYPKQVSYIAGCAAVTPCAIDQKTSELLGTSEGDGRVPWETGIPDGVRAYYLNASHGDLARHKAGFAAIADILETGETGRLPTSQPVTRGARTDELEPIPEISVDLFPDANDLVESAVGVSRTTETGSSELPVTVGIRHGNLRHSTRVVMGGHYQGDAIISAEAALNEVLQNKLCEAHDLGAYPGVPGTSHYFPNRAKRPPGALIIGLGYAGEVTPTLLHGYVRSALVKYALDVRDNSEEPQEVGSSISIGIAPLLLGTGAGELSIRQSIQATLRGVVEANEQLSSLESATRLGVRIDDVEFLELAEDKALQSATVVSALAQSPEFGGKISFDSPVRSSGTGEVKSVYSEPLGWWRRVQILEEDESLVYASLTDRAGIPVNLVPTQTRAVNAFIEQIMERTDSAPGFGKTLFERLLPPEMKDQMTNEEGLVLVLDHAAARYPWEMLDERSSQQRTRNRTGQAGPLATRVGLIRQLRFPDYPPHQPRVNELSALVVGDPKTSNLAGLWGARREASQVEKLLTGADFENVRLSLGAGGTEVLEALFDRDYKIIHLAAHGVYEKEMVNGEERVVRAGLVLDDDMYISTDEISQLSRLPELAFINCCHLGHVEPKRRDADGAQYYQSRQLIAANLATEFMRRGTRAVIAAGWEVSDISAAIFAETFYREFLEGGTFGDSVLSGRRAAFEAEPTQNTWGAYQCYGDPQFRLFPSKRAERRSAEPALALSLTISRLQNLRHAETQEETRKDARSQIEQIASDMPVSWLDNSALSASIGRAFGELKEFDKAIHYLNAAKGHNDAGCTLQDLEQLANFESRLAEKLSRTRNDANRSKSERREDQARAKALFSAAGKLLQTLRQIGDTPERWSLTGSHHKRQYLASSESSVSQLTKMTEGYWNAGCTKDKVIDAYAAINGITGVVILDWIGVTAPKDIPSGSDIDVWFDEIDQFIGKLDTQNIWTEMHKPDNRLIRHLHSRDLHDPILGRAKKQNWEALAESYEAILLNATDKQRDSVLTQFDFLMRALGDAADNKQKRNVEALEKLYGRLSRRSSP